jgi:hypothetical protein
MTSLALRILTYQKAGYVFYGYIYSLSHFFLNDAKLKKLGAEKKILGNAKCNILLEEEFMLSLIRDTVQ